MTEDVQVRPAVAADAGLLVEFALAMAAETEAKALERTTVERGIATALADPGLARYFVAERAGAVVGGLMLTYEWSDWRCGLWWWIQSVYVLPAARRQGVFSALYRAVEQAARAQPGVCGLRLYVERGNLQAQATYAALGMQDAHYQVLEAPLASG